MGLLRDRRFGAVQCSRDRGCTTTCSWHGAHGADVRRILAHDGLDPTDSAARGTRRMAVGVSGARHWPHTGNRGNSPTGDLSPKRGRGVRRARSTAVLLITALLLGTFALLAATGHDVGQALSALVNGSIGSWYSLGSGTLVRATPLMLTGLAVAIAFRAGVFNIGAEGQFVVGAAAAAAVGLVMAGTSRVLTVSIVLLSGLLAGAIWASIAGFLRLRFHVLEVISTIMLNFVALYLVSYLVRGPLQEPTHVYPQTSSIAAAAQLPRLGPTTRLHLGFVIALVACL